MCFSGHGTNIQIRGIQPSLALALTSFVDVGGTNGRNRFK